jgi:heme/copper-type cytochrome/quinol oxidase subunit 4
MKNTPKQKPMFSKEINNGLKGGIIGFVLMIYLTVSGIIVVQEDSRLDSLKYGILALIIYYLFVYFPLRLIYEVDKEKKDDSHKKISNLRRTLNSIVSFFFVFIFIIKTIPIISWLGLEDNLEGTGGMVVVGFGMSLSILVYAIISDKENKTNI